MENLFKDSWAVLIGIGAFKSGSIERLANPINDVNNIGKVLEEKCEFSSKKIFKLINHDATLENIKSIFDSDLSSKIGENDRLLVYFSGHGITRKKFGRQSQDIGYIIPYDAKRVGANYRYTSLLPFNDLMELIHNSTKSRQTLFILDCCFSGIATKTLGVDSEFERGLCVKDMIIAAKDKKSFQILTAGGPNEEILDAGFDPNVSILNHSIQKIVDDANPGDYPYGFVSARNIGKEANLMVGRRSILLKKSQTPRFSVSDYDDFGEFAFRKFSEGEMKDAMKTSVEYTEIEEIILNTSLKTSFDRENLLGILDGVEQQHGKNFSLATLRESVEKIVKEHTGINKMLDKIISEKGIDIKKREKILKYIVENLLSIGLSKNIFNPKFIEYDDLEEESIRRKNDE